jgi:enoyl-CoA hydratase
LALHCDIRVGTPDAKFAMPLARLGMVAPAYAIRRLIDSVGVSAARDLLLSADLIDADHALRIGLLTRLAQRDEAEDVVSRLAVQIARLAPLALREMKSAIARISANVAPALAAELDQTRLEVSRSADLKEGLHAFLDRRRPVFRGL